MRWLTLIALLWTTAAQAQDVEIVKNAHSLKLSIGGEVFSVYNLGHDYAKPFMYPVAAPGALDQFVAAGGGEVYVAQEQAKLKSGGTAIFGSQLTINKVERPWLKIAGVDDWINEQDVIPVAGFITRRLKAHAGKDYDHVHHKGIWVSIDEVNDIRYWAERGVIRNDAVEVLEASGDVGRFRVTNHWLGNDGEPMLEEKTTITVSPNRLLSYNIAFKALGQPVTFHDTKEGLFGIRLPNDMRESVAGAPVVGCNGALGQGDALDRLHRTGRRSALWRDPHGRPRKLPPVTLPRPQLRAVFDQPVRRICLHERRAAGAAVHDRGGRHAAVALRPLRALRRHCCSGHRGGLRAVHPALTRAACDRSLAAGKFARFRVNSTERDCVDRTGR